jgi:hypothetical protein
MFFNEQSQDTSEIKLEPVYMKFNFLFQVWLIKEDTLDRDVIYHQVYC